MYENFLVKLVEYSSIKCSISIDKNPAMSKLRLHELKHNTVYP